MYVRMHNFKHLISWNILQIENLDAENINLQSSKNLQQVKRQYMEKVYIEFLESNVSNCEQLNTIRNGNGMTQMYNNCNFDSV